MSQKAKPPRGTTPRASPADGHQPPEIPPADPDKDALIALRARG